MDPMLLPARKSPLLLPLYARYGRRLLRRAFARVWLGGAPWPGGGAGPVIGFLNHSAWWDPIVLLLLSHDVVRCDGYGLMQGAQLRRFPFFRQIGCFGATGDGIDDARAVAAHAAALLRGAPGAAPPAGRSTGCAPGRPAAAPRRGRTARGRRPARRR